MTKSLSRFYSLIGEHWPIVSILFAFLILATCYGIVTAVFEAPDEPAHYFYVKYIADTVSLPIITETSEEPWASEGHQPPLYYSLGALVTAWVDTSDALQLLQPNPHANIGHPMANANKNIFVHSDEERFPYRRAVLAIHLVRLLSTLLGAVTVLATYLTGLEVFPQNRTIALGASLLVALNPQFIFISSAVNNDSLVIALSSLALLFCIRLITKGPTARNALALGFLLGLAQMTKLSSLPLWLLLPFVLGLAHVKHHPPLKTTLQHTLLICLVALAISGWWFARNCSLYGDPTGFKAHFALQGTRTRTLTLRRLRWESQGLKMSFWAVFGWFNIVADDIIYGFFDLLSLAGLLGLAIAAARYLRNKRDVSLGPLGILCLWIGMIFLSLLWWNRQVMGFQGRLLFPAISAISLLLFYGLRQFFPDRYLQLLTYGLGAIMLTIALVVPFRYIAPAYARPRMLSVAELENAPRQLNITFGDCMKLLGYEVDPTIAQAGRSLELTLYWQAICPIDRNYSIFVHLLDDLESVIAQEDTFPGLGSFPTTQWQPGDAIADSYLLQIPATTVASSSAQLEVGMYDFNTGERLPVFSAEGELMGDQVPFANLGLESEAEPPHPVGVFFDFEHVLALAAYDFNQLIVSPGEKIDLTLYWRMLAQSEEDYWVLAQLVGKEGKVLLEETNRLQFNDLPTSALVSGQLIEDKHVLAIPPDVTEPGIYELRLSVYSPVTGWRLTIVGREGEPRGTELSLLRIRIAK